MQKVWILEGFVSREQMEKELEKAVADIQKAKSDAEIELAKEMATLYKKELVENPDGHWTGYEGKTNYKYFCDRAKETLRRMRKERMKWRVIEGRVDENSNTWVGYELVKENVGVMKYLWATL